MEIIKLIMKMNNKINQILKRLKKTLGKGGKFVPLHEPSISKLDIKSVQKCVKSSFVSSTGRKTF